MKRELEMVEEELNTAVQIQIISEDVAKRILAAYKEFKGDDKRIMLFLDELFKNNYIMMYSTLLYLKSFLTTIHALFGCGYHIEY